MRIPEAVALSSDDDEVIDLTKHGKLAATTAKPPPSQLPPRVLSGLDRSVSRAYHSRMPSSSLHSPPRNCAARPERVVHSEARMRANGTLFRAKHGPWIILDSDDEFDSSGPFPFESLRSERQRQWREVNSQDESRTMSPRKRLRLDDASGRAPLSLASARDNMQSSLSSPKDRTSVNLTCPAATQAAVLHKHGEVTQSEDARHMMTDAVYTPKVDAKPDISWSPSIADEVESQLVRETESQDRRDTKQHHRFHASVETPLAVAEEALRGATERSPVAAIQTAPSMESQRLSESLSSPSHTLFDGLTSVPKDLNLPLSKRVELAVGMRMGELSRDTDHATKAYLKRARVTAPVAFTSAPTSNDAANAVFAALRPMPFQRPGRKDTTGSSVVIKVETWPSQSRSIRQQVAVSATWCDTHTQRNVPQYAHFVRLQKNLLSPNVLMMNCWPYFGDDFQPVKADYDEYYALDIQDRPGKLHRLHVSECAYEYAKAALDDLDISWGDVLIFLFDRDVNVGTEPGARLAVKNRKDYYDEEFPVNSQKWWRLVSKLASDQNRLAKAAHFCDHFYRLAQLSAWHVARRSDLVRDHFQREEEALVDLSDRQCRVCFRFDCPTHGEYEGPDNRSDDEYESDEAVAADIINPPKVNFHKCVQFPASPKGVGSAQSGAMKARKNKTYWDAGDFAKPDEMGVFYPCDHPGRTCDNAGCSCYESKLPCEKSCSCSADCPRKIQGCACSYAKLKKTSDFICFKDDRCACYQMGRECDPDLCGACGVCTVLDPVNRNVDDILVGRCRNASIARGVPKHTLLGDSPVHELGLYACEHIRPHEFVGEYKGEIITKEEADRRGAIYEHQRLSYLFSLNKDQEIDSTYFGNKIRFINHDDKNAKNVYAVIMLVNTVHRIALFAERHIKPGEELFFDYGPKFPHEQLGAKKVRKSAPQLRNANLINTFFHVEDDVDELGKVRARKAAGRGRLRKAGAGPATTKKKSRRRLDSGAGGMPALRKSAVVPQLGRDVVRAATVGTKTTAGAAGVSRYGSEEQRISPGDRLAAYNISDDVSVDGMDLEADGHADEDFAPLDFEDDDESSDDLEA